MRRCNSQWYHLRAVSLMLKCVLYLKFFVTDAHSVMLFKIDAIRTLITCQSSDGEALGAFIDSFDELLKHCKRNNVSKALLYMQQALTTGSGGTMSLQQKQYLQVSGSTLYAL